MERMPEPIENYAMIGDCRSAALVGRSGSIDWLCLPRFDSSSMFARILGDESHGHWTLHPVGAEQCAERRYDDDTFTLISRWVTDTGEVDVIDLMPHGDGEANVVRRVVGVSGSVTIEQELRIRFDYADSMPWVRQVGTDDEPALIAIAGPDAIIVRGVGFTAIDHAHRAEFTVNAGDTVDTTLTWFPSHKQPRAPQPVDTLIDETREWWHTWARRSSSARWASSTSP